MGMLTPKKLNGLFALPTTSTANMTDMKTDATMTVTTAVTTKTAATTMTAAKMTVSPCVTTTRIAQEADKAAITGLITPSTP